MIVGKTTLVTRLLLVAAISMSSALNAASSNGQTAITPAGDVIKAGDRFGLKADATIFAPVESRDSPPAGNKYCAPTGTVFRVDSVDAPQATVTGSKDGESVNPEVTTDNKTGTTTTTLDGATSVQQTQIDSTLHVHIVDVPDSHFWSEARLIGIDPTTHACVEDPEKDATKADLLRSKDSNADLSANGIAVKLQVKSGNEYTVSVTEISHYGIYRNGWTWGALTIPYKFEFHDHSFQPKPTLGTYVGYETWHSGSSSATVLALGLGGSTQSNQTTSMTSTTSGGMTTGTSTSATSSGGAGTQVLYTLGFGQMFTLGGSFKGGLLFGWDWAGSSSGFKYEGRPWMSFALGAGF